ncbi:MAG: hypothetical protein ABSC48_07560 [Terracidiphilus sp.]|jgi:hypothetical protein
MFEGYERTPKGNSGTSFRWIFAAIVGACVIGGAAYLFWPSPYDHLLRRLHAGMTEQQVLDALAGEPRLVTSGRSPEDQDIDDPSKYQLEFPIKGKPWPMIIRFDRSKVIESWCENVEFQSDTKFDYYRERCHPITK